jgi:hypothetical protein
VAGAQPLRIYARLLLPPLLAHRAVLLCWVGVQGALRWA